MIAQLNKNLLTLEEQTQLVQGSVGETVKLQRSDDWMRMTATAVFSNGEQTRDVIVSGETLLIPWELLQEEGRRLTLNFHGVDESGCVVQTNIASLGRIKKSNSPSGIPPEAPTPARADQIQALAQEAMAAAAALQASAASGAFDGVSPQVSVQAVDGGHTVSITDRSGTHSFTVLDGETGSGSVDDALSDSSENPVQNRVLNSVLKGKADIGYTSFTVSGNTVSLALSFSRVIALANNLYRFVGDANSMIPLGFFRLSSFQYVTSPYSATFSTVIGGEQYEIVLFGEKMSTNPMTGTIVKKPLASELFFAEYGVSEASELEAAFQSGKTLVCRNGNTLYPLLFRTVDPLGQDESPSFLFGLAVEDGYRSLLCDGGTDPVFESQWRIDYTSYHASTAPAMDGTAYAGTSAAYARADHVHPSDTAKITAPANPAAGAFLVWNGSAWAAQTLAAWQGGDY